MRPRWKYIVILSWLMHRFAQWKTSRYNTRWNILRGQLQQHVMTNAHSIISRNVLIPRLLFGERARVRSRRRSYYTRRRISYIILLQRSRALPPISVSRAWFSGRTYAALLRHSIVGGVRVCTWVIHIRVFYTYIMYVYVCGGLGWRDWRAGRQ